MRKRQGISILPKRKPVNNYRQNDFDPGLSITFPRQGYWMKGGPGEPRREILALRVRRFENGLGPVLLIVL
jgi:hypothetical protein